MYYVSWNCPWRYPLSDWGSPPIPICWQFAFMDVLDFIKSVPASMMMSILFYFVTLINYINWILGVETIRHSWDKYYLVFIMLFIYCLINLLIFCLSIFMRQICISWTDFLIRSCQDGSTLLVSENVCGRWI